MTRGHGCPWAGGAQEESKQAEEHRSCPSLHARCRVSRSGDPVRRLAKEILELGNWQVARSTGGGYSPRSCTVIPEKAIYFLLASVSSARNKGGNAEFHVVFTSRVKPVQRTSLVHQKRPRLILIRHQVQHGFKPYRVWDEVPRDELPEGRQRGQVSLRLSTAWDWQGDF